MDSTLSWDATPCSLIEICRRFGGTYCFHLQGRRVRQGSKAERVNAACLNYSSILKIEAIRLSETSVNSTGAERCHIPRNNTILVASEVPTAVVVKSTIFWDITDSLNVNRRFGGTYRLHLQGCTWHGTSKKRLYETSATGCYSTTP
jgi:hypothetical protein